MEPVAGKMRWIAATLVGLGVWAAATFLIAPFLATTQVTLVSPFIALVPGILVAGWIVGARSGRRWRTVGGLVFALALVVMIGSLIAFVIAFSGGG